MFGRTSALLVARAFLSRPSSPPLSGSQVQLSWAALLRCIKRKHMSKRNMFEMLDADGGDSLDYAEFNGGLRSFKPLYEDLSGEAVELLIQSLFPDTDSEVNWEIFDRVTGAYQAQFFPNGSFGEWAGRRLLDERKAMRALEARLAEQQAEARGLRDLVDELRVTEAAAEETSAALTAAKSQLATVVSTKDELVRAHHAMDNMRRELDR